MTQSKIRKEKRDDFKKKNAPVRSFLPFYYRLEASSPKDSAANGQAQTGHNAKKDKKPVPVTFVISLSESSSYSYSPEYPVKFDGRLPTFITEALVETYEKFELKNTYEITYTLKNGRATFKSAGSYLKFPGEGSKIEPAFTKPLKAFIAGKVYLHLSKLGVKKASDLLSESQLHTETIGRLISNVTKMQHDAERRFNSIVRRIQNIQLGNGAKQDAAQAPPSQIAPAKNLETLKNTKDAAIEITQALKEEMPPSMRKRLVAALEKMINAMHGLSV